MKKLVCLFLAVLIAGAACSNKPKGNASSTQNPSGIQQDDISDDTLVSEDPPASDNPLDLFLEELPEPQSNFQLSRFTKSYRGNVQPNFPSRYLSEPLEFKDIPLKSPFPGKKIAVVGYDRAKLYADVFKSGKNKNASVSSLQVLTSIPIGTVLPILGEYKAAPSDENYQSDLYNFEKEWNYFYRTEYQGKEGVVFGADLIMGDKKPEEDLMRLSYYYTKPTASPFFVRTIGMKELAPDHEQVLRENFIAFAEAPPYPLDLEHPDDLVSLYQQAFNERSQTVFITTDLLVHSLHLLFDRMLSETEDRIFIPRLKHLLEGALSEVNKRIEKDTKEVPAYSEALTLAKNYLFLAKALLAMALPPVPDEYHPSELTDNPLSEEDARQAIEAQLPPSLQEEFRLIMEARGFSLSPNFGYREDYSQFIPRGHYTKSTRLKAYFRTMMFLGRINFYLDFSTPEAARLSNQLGPAALILCQALQASGPRGSLKELWQSLFDPISYLIGESDDLNLYDIEKAEPAIARLDILQLFKTGKTEEYLKNLAKKLRPPRIQGNINFGNPSGANTPNSGDRFGEPPRGWRLFGQRFVLDSSWFDRLTGEYRTMPSGLDVAASLGSKTAYEFLTATREKLPPYAQALEDIRKEVSTMKEDAWWQTFYLGYLDTVRRILTFERGAGFYFTQKPLWNIKSLQSGLAAWAELRHDTILYVKQSYAEAAGGDGIEATYRTIDFPRPIHYVEPNLRFFYDLTSLLERSLPLLKKYEFLTPQWMGKFEAFLNILDKLTVIVEKEVVNNPISVDENEYLATVPFLIARIIRPDGDVDTGDTSKYQMAMVADVHTDGDNGQVLEVATGKPFMLYVALNDGQGGKRIAVGFTYSYYEFPHPMNDRLTDEKWKAFIYGNPSKKELEAKRPEWLRGLMP